MMRSAILRAASLGFVQGPGQAVSLPLRALCTRSYDQQQDPAQHAWLAFGRWAGALGGVAAGAMLTCGTAAAEEEQQQVAAAPTAGAPVSGPDQVVVLLPDGSKVIVIPPPGGVAAADAAEGGCVRVSRPRTKLPEVAALSGPFQLPALPYALDALEPHMSADTLATHWGKHHHTYLSNLNKQVASLPELAGLSLEEVVITTWNGGKPTAAFNNAAQSWNHAFFWTCLKPGGSTVPPPDSALGAAITRDFGGAAELVKALETGGATQFGSGWVWLLSDANGQLKVMKTSNAVTPIVAGWVPLLVMDVWEHAYYLDYANRRPDYLAAVLEHLIDWEAAQERYAAVVAST